MKRFSLCLIIGFQIILLSCEKQEVLPLNQLSLDIEKGKVGPTSKILPPKNLVGTIQSSTSIQLKWKDNSSNETGFVVERKVAGGSYNAIATLPVNSTSYLDNGLEENIYVYRIKVFNNSSSAYSNEITVNLIDITSGLIAYYPFNGNANDESGNGNHGTVLNAILTSDRFGISNSAYHFAPNEVIKVYNPSSELNLSNSFSISLWFKLDDLNNAYNYFAFASNHDGDIGNDGWLLGIQKYSYYMDFSANGLWGMSSFTSGPIITALSWYNYIITFDINTHIMSAYLNNQLLQSIEVPLNMIAGNRPITFGHCFSTYGTYYDYINGIIDDVYFYNRALTQSEISYLATH